MADGYIQLAPDSTGKKIDSSELTVGANTVERQRSVIADDAGTGNLASVQAKGTQAGYALSVQEFKDTGRTLLTLILDAVTGITTEALATMAINNGGIASSASSFTVPAGKILRIQSIVATVKASSTVANTGRVRLRAGTTLSVSSPALVTLDVPAMPGTAAAGTGNWAAMDFPDGLELVAGQQIGISHIESATTSTVSVTVVGFYY